MADELSPAQEARLRRLLARSRHDERLPDDVGARLDDVLSRLEAGDPVLESWTGQVHELAARRRRRKVTSLLVAAAAVVVAGVGLGQVVDGADLMAGEGESSVAADSSEGRSDGDAAGGQAELDDAAEAEEFSALSGGAGSAGSSSPGVLDDPLVVGGRLADVPEERFTRAALRLQRRVSPVAMTGQAQEPPVPLSTASRGVQRAWEACAPTYWGDGTAVAVRYAGGPAVLVFRMPAGDTQVVELLQCGTGAQLRSATLPVG